MLSEVYAKRENHEAVKFVKIAVQNYKPVDSKHSLWFHSALRVASKFSIRLKSIEETIQDPNKARREWREWADEYLSWYNETMSK